MLVFIVIVVLVATGLALAAAVAYRRGQLARRVRLELTNLGNVQSRYQVRAEDVEDRLEFQFTLHGDPLIPQSPAEPVQAIGRGLSSEPAFAKNPYEKPAGALAAADGAMNAGGAIAGFLGTLGLLLPRSVGAPLLQASGQLRRKEIAVARVRSVPTQVSRVSRLVPRPLQRLFRGRPAVPTRGAASAPTNGTLGWAETPLVEPGNTLAIDLVIRSGMLRPRQPSAYRVLSRAANQDDAPLVVEQGSVLFGAGFWTRRVLPYLAILATAALLLLLAFWLTSVGVLA